MLSRQSRITRPSLLRRASGRPFCFTSRLHESQDSSSKNEPSDPRRTAQDRSPASAQVPPTAVPLPQQIKTSSAGTPPTSSPSFVNPQRNQPGRPHYNNQFSPASPRPDPRQAFAQYGPPQGFPRPPQGYSHPPQGYPGPPQGYPRPPQGYPRPPQGYPRPSQGYSNPPQNYSYPQSYPHRPQNYPHPPQHYSHPSQDLRQGPPRWPGPGGREAQGQFARPNNPGPNYPQGFPYNQSPPLGQHQPRGSDHRGSLQHPGSAPDSGYPAQPQHQASQGSWRGPPDIADDRARSASLDHNPALGTPPPTEASDPYGSPSADDAESGPSSSSLASVLASRRKAAAGSSQSYGFDMSDVSGLHTLDQFVGNQSRSQAPTPPISPREPQNAQFPRHTAWNQGPQPFLPHQHRQNLTGANQGRRHGYMGPTPPSFDQRLVHPPAREGLSWSPNRTGFAARGGMAGARGGARGGGGRGRGRGNAPGMQRGRGRGALFSRPEFPEPSLPPPPKSVLNEKGEFGKALSPSGCPYGLAGLSAGTEVGGKRGVDLSSATDHKTIKSLLLNSSTPVQLPGFGKPIQSSPVVATDLVKSNYEIESGGSTLSNPEKRADVVGRARNLVSQNVSMNINQKRQTVAVVDFLLLSKEERMQRVV